MEPSRFQQKFEKWQQGLLDTGRRNKMMNYRRLKRSSLELTSPSLAELYRRIAVKDEAVTFEKQVELSAFPNAQKTVYLFGQAGSPVTVTAGEIKTAASLDDSPVILRNLRAKARLSREEQGIHTLYLCFGFLEWRQKPGDDELFSPLILVPVNLTLDSLTAPYRIRRTDGDTVVNPTLAHVLAHDHHLTLPEFDAAQDPEDYFATLEDLVGEYGWRVRREVNLGLLSFLKIVMYRDITAHRESIARNPVVRALCGDPAGLVPVDPAWQGFPHDTEQAFGHYQVLDADASQQDAMLLSRKGVSFVLQGPPGTGKSQTIANIIAEAVGEGKKVLFVSEKMAALSVVYHRLEETGLASCCLSLHSDKADKKEVVADILRTLEEKNPVPGRSEADFLVDYERLRGELNRYFDELKTRRLPLGKSVYEAISEIMSLKSCPQLTAPAGAAETGKAEFLHRQDLLRRIGLAAAQAQDAADNPWSGSILRSVSYETSGRIKEVTEGLTAAANKLQAAAEFLNMEYGTGGKVTIGNLFGFLEAAETLKATEGSGDSGQQSVPRPLSALETFLRALDLPETNAPEGKERADAFLRLSALPVILDRERFGRCGVTRVRGMLREFNSFAGQLKENREEILSEWSEEIFSLDYEEIYGRFRSGRYFLRGVFNMQYRNDRRTLSLLRRKGCQEPGDYECLSVLEKLARCSELEKKRADLCRSLFAEIGLQTAAKVSPKEAFEVCSHALDELSACLSVHELTGRELELLSAVPRAREQMPVGPRPLKDWRDAEAFCTDQERLAAEQERLSRKQREDLRRQEALARLKAMGIEPAGSQEIAGLTEFADSLDISGQVRDCYGGFRAFFGEGEIDSLSPAEFTRRADGCRSLSGLYDWISLARLTEECESCGLGEFLSEARKKNAAPQEWQDCYTKAFLQRWIDEVTERNGLAFLYGFRTAEHRMRIEDFAGLDQRRLVFDREMLSGILAEKNQSSGLAAAGSEEALLRREAGKKRRLMPLRKLFAQIPGLLQKAKPVFLMSPLSVAYFLDSERFAFDLVIFDEASQILPEDAVGAIYRASQVIIAGDTRQMPPTSFFAALANNDEDDFDLEEDESGLQTEAGESILDEAAAVLPSCTLLWHYRSRDESLIAFSNREIYGSRLITFPGCRKEEDRGLEYIYVPDGIYEGQGKNRNLREARKCAELVEEHIRKHPERSLGVIAFSEKQQGAIEDAVTALRAAHPEYEAFFDENAQSPFFVKNLENVQGDERDTIIFSICYARNAQGRMYMNFGPLGQTGGERRLNVAITRAKYNVKLVGSILPGDIDLNRTRAEGTRLLKAYIAYAIANGSAEDDGAALGRRKYREDAFADAVEAFLAQQGYQVSRNVGYSACRVDIAVRGENGYAAGLDCDSDSYTAARTARDRDVARARILADMGWQLKHLWAAAWARQPEEEQKALLSFLDQAGAVRITESSRPEEGQSLPGDADETAEAFAPYIVTDAAELARQVPGEDVWEGMARRILCVLETEQPIHRELLCQRIAPAYGYTEATMLVRRMVDQCVNGRLSQDIIADGDFLSLRIAGAVRARVPGEPSAVRKAEYIPDAEIDDALARLKGRAGETTQESTLTAMLAQLFGLGRDDEVIARKVRERNRTG